MRKFLLSSGLALLVLGAVALSSAEAQRRGWRRGGYGPVYYGASYYAPAYSYSVPSTVYYSEPAYYSEPTYYSEPVYSYSEPVYSYSAPAYTSYYTPPSYGYVSGYGYRPSVGVWVGGRTGWGGGRWR